MRYLIIISLILTLGLALLVGTVWLLGHQQPVPITLLFTNPDGTACERPCLFGIRPGYSSYVQAALMLRAFYVSI